MWNDIGPHLRGAESISIFKNKILKLYRPVKKSLFNIHDPYGIKWIFQLRVGLSPLKSHKMNHNFKDTLNDTCQCKRSGETSHHFFLHCSLYIDQRRALFQTLNPIMEAKNLQFVDDKALVNLLLYGHDNFSDDENHDILKATINFIRKTSRFTNLNISETI